ncbi:OCIA domain-containing protein 1-like [Xenia sp. Carnegie-2017]|uniref:OCIA domain-containing protein 1-like n=1 Tax=Xenia sp. Carnegie-2017 TaxID=2897299 RepID=UPI001F034BBE|nr:OCIA domain-containing protein 1-like [Xenia sp. Carnegie-2017]
MESLQLTEEERKVLRECRVNSMFRGVPTGIFSAFLTSFAVRSGRFPHLAKWSRFYYGVTFTGGLLFGVASYRRTCLEKIMSLENSVLAEQVNEYLRRSGVEYIGQKHEKKDSEFDDSNPYDVSRDVVTGNTPYLSSELKSENDRRTSSSTLETSSTLKDELSFEERRKQHRQQFSMNQYPIIRSTRKPNERTTPSHEKPSTESLHQDPSAHVKKNIYGDPIE